MGLHSTGYSLFGIYSDNDYGPISNWLVGKREKNTILFSNEKDYGLCSVGVTDSCASGSSGKKDVSLVYGVVLREREGGNNRWLNLHSH